MSPPENDYPLSGEAWPTGTLADAFPPENQPDDESLRASALRRARWLVDFYRITRDELEAALAEPLQMPTLATETVERPAKYRHPVTGETWDGVGPHPDWMRQALLKDGYRVAELRVSELSF